MRLLYLRHGQTEWNTSARFQGTTDIDLDDTGRAQAAEAAKVLALAAPRLIVSSDLRRASDTAQAVADLVGVPVQLDKRLRERSYGKWEGLTRPQIEERFPDDYDRWRRRSGPPPAGIEPPADVAERCLAALTDITAGSEEDDTVLVVGHGGSARQSVGALLGWDQKQTDSVTGMNNCHWADLRTGRAGWLLTGYNISARIPFS